MKKLATLIAGVIILSFVLGIIFYDDLPDKVASHWNTAGEVDGYMSKFCGLFLMPAISVMIVLLFVLILKVDPLKKNIRKFGNYFEGMIFVIVLFLFYLQILTIFANFGYDFNIIQMTMPALGILYFFVGIVLEKAKRNWFVGIRTPWTLSSDRVWDGIHLAGGKLFKLSGIIALSGLALPSYAVWFAVVPVLVFSVYLFGYSYYLFAKTKRV
jgi:uncharacterized membrane protein